jgi:hypothetical protein
MDSFTCPHCQKKQEEIGVVSKCTQHLTLATDEWDDLEVGETLSIYCLFCGEDLPVLLQDLKNTNQLS